MERQSTDQNVTPPPPPAREHIITRPGYCGGKPHIAGHRIKVQHVALWYERLGKSPDEIIAEHPGLTLADVYAALTYYYDHREQIDADILADEEFVAGLKAKSPPALLLRRLS
jgi:uncharacterized protein (DUF433 family)